MHRKQVLAICLLAAGFVCAQQQAGRKGAQPREIGPEPPVVDPGGPGKPPSDAIVLFNGRDNTGWTILDDSPVPARPGSYKDEGKPSKCKVSGGAMICRTGDGDVQTTEKFHSAQIHLEFSEPNLPDAPGWARGNSGAILLKRYEVQIVDSYHNDTGPGSEACAGFDAFGPLVNACRPPGRWQTYDIIFHGPTCAADGSVQTPGSLTVLQNSVLVQDHVPVRGRNCVSEGPLVLQDHSRSVGRKVAFSPTASGPAPDTTMKFRNIWMRRLSN